MWSSLPSAVSWGLLTAPWAPFGFPGEQTSSVPAHPSAVWETSTSHQSSLLTAEAAFKCIIFLALLWDTCLQTTGEQTCHKNSAQGLEMWLCDCWGVPSHWESSWDWVVIREKRHWHRPFLQRTNELQRSVCYIPLWKCLAFLALELSSQYAH